MTAETAPKSPTRFKPGQSGNPRGRPQGSRNRASLACEALIEGKAKALTEKLVALAEAGDVAALRMCMDRLCPPRKDRHVTFALPRLETAADAVAAMAAIVEAVAAGDLTPSEANDMARLVETYRATLETSELADLLARLEAEKAGGAK